MKITEQIHRCKYCKREMHNTSDQRAGNPFCTACLPERTKLNGHYEFTNLGNGYVGVKVVQDTADSRRAEE